MQHLMLQKPITHYEHRTLPHVMTSPDKQEVASAEYRRDYTIVFKAPFPCICYCYANETPPTKLAQVSIRELLHDSPQIRAAPYGAHEETTLTLHHFLGTQASQRRVVDTWKKERRFRGHLLVQLLSDRLKTNRSDVSEQLEP